MKSMIKKIIPSIIMMLILCNLHLIAQVTTASITGMVYDEKSMTLPGANIIALHLPSGTKYIITSRANGSFTIPNARTGGPYTLTVTFVGYGETVIDEINLSLGQELEIDVPMRVSGTDIKEVVVSGKQDRVFNSDRTGAATTINNETLRSLPTLSRSISDMTRLTPQATGNNTFAGRNNLYNNLSINGSVFNNSFGLSSTPGGQTSAQPISLDAIDQIQVSLAPYDVRQSGFTGAGINAITRSGTNEFTGSAYRYWRNQNYVGSKVAGNDVTNSNFDQSQMGFRLGGPIIKNKLFFFVNGEMKRKTEPAHTWLATRPELTGTNVTTVPATQLDSLKDFLISKYNYNPGEYENFSLKTYNDKMLIRLDYNIAKNHKLSINYNYLKSWKVISPSTGNSATSRSANPNTLWFSNSAYQINNNINSLVAELNSSFGNWASNNLIVGYSAFRDFRTGKSDPFPVVDILRNKTTLTSFGYEQYTPNNKLNTDVFQVSDNFSIYLGKHTITIGGAYEHFKFENGFTPQYNGYYRYSSLNDFYADARDGKVVALENYQLTYSAVVGGTVPMAKVKTAQLGFYAQDELRLFLNLKVTAGVRVDLPSYPASLPANATLNDLTFQDEKGNTQKIDVSKLPDQKLMFSPRIGFNWDVFHNKQTQVRGGIGVFTGRIPFVWISNQASNNGVLFGNIFANNTKLYPFSDDVTKYIPANPTAPATVLINATSSNFSFPQVFRANLAVDQKLPYGIIATLEGIYTKDLNAVIHHDYNLKMPSGQI